jgi:hypothetical protein
VIRKLFYSKYGNDIINNITSFDIYVKINNIPTSQIKINTYVDIFNYHTKNNTVMTPFFDNIYCYEHDCIDINCFSKVELIKNNKFDYIWLKIEKIDKTLFIENIDFYMIDINNTFKGFYFDIIKTTHIDMFNNLIIENSNESILYNNVNLINGNYSMYNLYVNISKYIKLKKKIYSIYFRIKLNN